MILACIALLWIAATMARAADDCSGCHAAIARSYAQTGMARSFGLAGLEVPEGAFRHEASAQTFAVFKRGGKPLLKRYQLAENGSAVNVLERTIDYWFGSGNHARGYVSRTAANELTELPITFYAEKGGRWGMSPGYDQPEHAGFSRRISYRCMFCHNAYPEITATDNSAAIYPAKLPEGIDCQRCHGPGGDHIKAARNGRPAAEIRETIVNPRRLTPARQMEVCLQCHLETTTRRLPAVLPRFGRDVFSYRPGEPLAAYALHFDQANPGDRFEFNSSAYRLRQSACFIASRGTMTCVTCHNPHEPSGSRASAACQNCHASAIAKKSHPASRDCAPCHMPKRTPTDAIHVSITDHYIQRRPAPNQQPPVERNDSNTPPYRGEVTPYYPATLQDDLYLAIAQVKDGANLGAGLRRLETAIAKAKPELGDFYFELGEAYRQAGRFDEAVLAYRQACSRTANSWRFFHGLGSALASAGDLQGSEEALRTAVKLAPAEPVALQALAQTLSRQEKVGEAIAILGQIPESAEARNALGLLRLRLGDVSSAETEFREAVRLRPEIAAMHNNLAAALIRLGKPDGAIREYRAPLGARPESATIHYNLAVALAGQGRLAEAERSLHEALRLAPDYYEAHLKLGQILVARGDAAGVEHLRKAAQSPDPRVREAAKPSGSP